MDDKLSAEETDRRIAKLGAFMLLSSDDMDADRSPRSVKINLLSTADRAIIIFVKAILGRNPAGRVFRGSGAAGRP
jgi:hypothetical protein